MSLRGQPDNGRLFRVVVSQHLAVPSVLDAEFPQGHEHLAPFFISPVDDFVDDLNFANLRNEVADHKHSPQQSHGRHRNIGERFSNGLKGLTYPAWSKFSARGGAA